jgi:hypothetical protein
MALGIMSECVTAVNVGPLIRNLVKSRGWTNPHISPISPSHEIFQCMSFVEKPGLGQTMSVVCTLNGGIEIPVFQISVRRGRPWDNPSLRPFSPFKYLDIDDLEPSRSLHLHGVCALKLKTRTVCLRHLFLSGVTGNHMAR